MSFLNECDESYTKQADVMNMAIDNKMMHLNIEYSKVMLEHKKNLNDIEYKVMMESGNEDDLILLYTAEAEETQKKGEGIIRKIINAIKNFFKQIRSAFTGQKIDKDSLPDNIEVKYDPNEVIKEGKEINGRVNSFLKNFVFVAGATAAVAGTYKLVKDAVLPTVENMKQLHSEQEEKIKNIEKTLESGKCTPEQVEDLTKLLNELKENAKKSNTIMGTIHDLKSDEYEKIANDNKDKREQEKQDKKDEKEQKKYDEKRTEIDANINSLSSIKKALNDKIVKIDKLIIEYKKKIKALKKDVGATEDDNFIDRRVMKHQQKKLTKYHNMSASSRTERQTNKMFKLHDKYGDHVINKISKLKQYENMLLKLQREREKLFQELQRVTDDEMKYKEKGIDLDQKHGTNQHGGANPTGSSESLINNATSLLEESVTDIESFIDIML